MLPDFCKHRSCSISCPTPAGVRDAALCRMYVMLHALPWVQDWSCQQKLDPSNDSLQRITNVILFSADHAASVVNPAGAPVAVCAPSRTQDDKSLSVRNRSAACNSQREQPYIGEPIIDRCSNSPLGCGVPNTVFMLLIWYQAWYLFRASVYLVAEHCSQDRPFYFSHRVIFHLRASCSRSDASVVTSQKVISNSGTII